MNFIQLEYFRRVVESGSVTQASKALFITQPAVSKQIRLLEEELGCELFIRRANHLVLTREGDFLYAVRDELISASCFRKAHHRMRSAHVTDNHAGFDRGPDPEISSDSARDV